VRDFKYMKTRRIVLAVCVLCVLWF